MHQLPPLALYSVACEAYFGDVVMLINSVSLLQKGGLGSLDWNVSMVNIHL